MQQLRILRNAVLAATIVLAASATARATDMDDDAVSPGDEVCAGLSDGARGLCNAYCNAQDCPTHPEENSCVVLRRNFERQTGLSTFPCDGEVIATATMSPTRTATALQPTRTPTDTPGATGTATATRTAASPTATVESTLTPTAEVTATPTSPATLTPTAEAGETATSSATATETATPAGIPTGTAAAAASCDEVGGSASFVCDTFCEVQNCPSDPHPFCDELRAIFASWTGTSVFPCERDQSTATPTPQGSTLAGACMGDCSGDGEVDISDLTQFLLIVLGERDPAECVGALHDGQRMSIGDMVLAVRHALDGCS